MTYAVQLESVQTAIAAIESGAQAYSVGGRSLTRGDLSVLYAREKWLRRMADAEANGRSGGARVSRIIPID